MFQTVYLCQCHIVQAPLFAVLRVPHGREPVDYREYPVNMHAGLVIPAVLTWFAHAVPARCAFAGGGPTRRVWPVHHAVAG